MAEGSGSESSDMLNELVGKHPSTRGAVCLDSSGLRVAESGAVPARAASVINALRHAAKFNPESRLAPTIVVETTNGSIVATHYEGLTLAVFKGNSPTVPNVG